MISLKVKEYIQRKIKLTSYPKILNIETTNFCNLNCPMCVAKDTREQGFLDIDFLKRIIRENKKVLSRQFIWLHFNGEPLLHPHLSEIIKILKKNRIRTRFSTNAVLLNKKKALELMEAGLDYIVFSIDGYIKKSYENIKLGANFEKVEDNIRNFLEIKKDKGFKTKTQVQFIKMKENKGEEKLFINKWRKTDINYINIKSFCSRAGKVYGMDRFIDISTLIKRIKRRLPCFYFWETLVILWNGKVICCCQDLLGELEVGDLKKETLIDIWNSPKLIELRKKQLENDFSTGPCRDCPDWKFVPNRYVSYFFDSAIKWFFKEIFKKEKKDEGINIIFNKK